MFLCQYSSLQEKPTSTATFHQLESSGESQSFLNNEPVNLSAITTQNLLTSTTLEEKLSPINGSPQDSPQRKSLYDLSKLGENELIVREETRVSISWSRDNSPAPTPTTSTYQPTNEQDKLKEPDEQTVSLSEKSKGARKKIIPAPLKSSHETKNHTGSSQQQDDEAAAKQPPPPPSKALLQKIAMKETEPRKK